ncbi:MAG: putative esterase [Rhodospirillales bacterium]|nr:putative esterase [Rhodospirillales bacterium]
MIGRREPQQNVAAAGARTVRDQTAAANANFVLLHGAWHGGWCWRHVAQLLRASGAQVFTPTLTGLGERYHLRGPQVGLETHINDVLSLLENEELDDVTLVAHSYGGAIAQAVADRARGRLRQLALLDSDLLEDGESTYDFFAVDAAAIEQKRADAVDGLGVAAPRPSRFGVPESNQEATDWLQRRLTPHPLKSLEDRLQLHNGGGGAIPALFVHCTRPTFTGIDRSLARAAARGWRISELAEGHDAMVTAPGAVAELLLKLI